MLKRLGDEFSISVKYINNLITLFLEGNTVPFIARYRKEATGKMDEVIIRQIIDRYEYLLNLDKRKSEIINLINEKGKLTEELRQSIIEAETLKQLEDIYAPYKSKRKTKGDVAKELGLLSLSAFIRSGLNEDAIKDEAGKYLNENVKTVEEAITFALDIIIEEIGHNIQIKNRLRELYLQEGKISAKKSKGIVERTKYEDYYNFEDLVKKITPHKILALFRGEREKVLKIDICIDDEKGIGAIKNILASEGTVLNKYILTAAEKAYKRILSDSINLEIRGELKEKAEKSAINVFEENLKKILLTPPVKNKRILGMDPAYRTGCKYAAIDETGKLLKCGVVYPVKPQEKIEESEKEILDVVKTYNIDAIAIGNGTASRELEEFVSNFITKFSLDISYTIVSESGASVYSASAVGAEEFPELDLTMRSAVSIGRRVIDPLSELVKVEPKSIGVGMYQHDVNQTLLKKRLDFVVEDVVNKVGVDLNTASYSILSYVSGLNKSLAQKIVQFRNENGPFRCRGELLKISGIGENTYKQCAGFLKIYGGEEFLDSMFIHPENYGVVYKVGEKFGVKPREIKSVKPLIIRYGLDKIAEELGVGKITLKDILDTIEKPDIDIRDNIPPVIFKKGVININDLETGMILKGKVTNVLDFGVFVDLGLKNSGLVHISEISDKFIKHPSQAVSVGDVVDVKILQIDQERGRISLSMKI